MSDPQPPDRLSSSLKSAWHKGVGAYSRKEPRHSNPYEDVRTVRGAITWSRAFRKVWFDGYDAAACAGSSDASTALGDTND